MHIQGRAAADLHHDSFENKQMLLTVQQAPKKHLETEMAGKDLKFEERLRCEGGHSAPYPMVSACVVLRG